MGGLISLIAAILPVVLKLIAIIAGGGAAISAQRLGVTPEATWAQWGGYVGGWGGAAATAWSAGELAAWLRRRSANGSIDWPRVVSGVSANGGLNLIKLISLVARVFQLVSQDPEARKLFSEAFGVPASSMPHDGNAIASLALVRRD